ncbi:MAG: hypothetical protein J6R22_03555 [Alphaproteobacteria bacterium]|nr:hypothetical protein [Alphaproteobacteria bacterium]
MSIKSGLQKAIKKIADRKEAKKKERTERLMSGLLGDILRGITGNKK